MTHISFLVLFIASLSASLSVAGQRITETDFSPPLFESTRTIRNLFGHTIEGTNFVGKESVVQGLSEDPYDAVVDSIVANNRFWNPGSRPVPRALVTSRYASGSVKTQEILLGGRQKVKMGTLSYDLGEVVSKWLPGAYKGNVLGAHYVRNAKMRELQTRAADTNTLTAYLTDRRGRLRLLQIAVFPESRPEISYFSPPGKNQWLVTLRDRNRGATDNASYYCMIELSDSWVISGSECKQRVSTSGNHGLHSMNNYDYYSLLNSDSIADAFSFLEPERSIKQHAVHHPIKLNVPASLSRSLKERGFYGLALKEMVFYSTDGFHPLPGR